VDWNTHLEIMYKFWGSMVFSETSYRGNPFNKHMPLPVETKHFDRWLELFLSNLDLQFVGANADLFKERSKSIALIFDYKLKALKNED
jgi:hemoglobin